MEDPCKVGDQQEPPGRVRARAKLSVSPSLLDPVGPALAKKFNKIQLKFTLSGVKVDNLTTYFY